MGAAFGRVVTTLVESVLMPPIGVVVGGVDFSSLFYVLDHSKGTPASLADAKAKGIPVVAFGEFINVLINFLIVAFAVFMLVQLVNRLKRRFQGEPEAASPTTRECPFCASGISIKARRCPHCTSQLS